jgi:segregation and condensation protein A
MQVLEKTIPWWRKALNFALGGIRSGFGLFQRPARLETVAVPMFSGGYKEKPEEERTLTKAFPKIEMDAPATPAEAGANLGPIDAPKHEPERVKGEAGGTRGVSEDTPSGAKAQVDSVGVTRGLPPPPPSETSFSAASEPEDAVEAETTREVLVEPEPETALLPATESNVVTEAEPATIPAVEVLNEPAPVPVEEVESEEDVEPVDEPETEKSINAEVVTETVPEPVEEAEHAEEAMPGLLQEAEPVVEPETNDNQETVDGNPSEPFKEPDSVAETELKAAAEPETSTAPAPVSTIEQAAPAAEPELDPVSEPISAPEPAVEVSPEKETAHIPMSQIATEPERAPEPIVEQIPAADEALPLVLTAESDAKEKADAKADEKAAAKLMAQQKKRDESSEQSPFSVFVGQVYDGPLDLLLDLIRKQDIDIYDIPIARITAQFLAYVNQLKAGDVDVAGEFIYTASLLIHIKSKMLLPRAPSGPEDVAEDPRRELVERLLEHERFKNAAQMLQQKQMLEAATWSNPGVREFKGDEGAEPEIAADTVDLVRIFRDILERARNRPVLDVEEDSVTVGQMIQFLARRLTMEDKPVALRRLLSHTRSERALIAMFLALLEMVRLQAILLRQDRQFSEIFIKKHTGFDTVMNEGLGNARDDWR